MATSLIADKTAAETSTDFAVTTTPVTVMLSYSPANAPTITRVYVDIDMKDAAGNYIPVYKLYGTEKAVQVAAPGTYRVRKQVTTYEVGVDMSP